MIKKKWEAADLLDAPTAAGARVRFPDLSDDKVLQKKFAQQRQPILWQRTSISPLLNQPLLNAAAHSEPVVVEVVLAHMALDSWPAHYFIKYGRQPILKGLDIEGSLVTGDLKISPVHFPTNTLDIQPNSTWVAIPLPILVGDIDIFTNRAWCSHGSSEPDLAVHSWWIWYGVVEILKICSKLIDDFL
jgi:hypothetical protein